MKKSTILGLALGGLVTVGTVYYFLSNRSKEELVSQEPQIENVQEDLNEQENIVSDQDTTSSVQDSTITHDEDTIDYYLENLDSLTQEEITLTSHCFITDSSEGSILSYFKPGDGDSIVTPVDTTFTFYDLNEDGIINGDEDYFEKLIEARNTEGGDLGKLKIQNNRVENRLNGEERIYENLDDILDSTVIVSGRNELTNKANPMYKNLLKKLYDSETEKLYLNQYFNLGSDWNLNKTTQIVVNDSEDTQKKVYELSTIIEKDGNKYTITLRDIGGNRSLDEIEIKSEDGRSYLTLSQGKAYLNVFNYNKGCSNFSNSIIDFTDTELREVGQPFYEQKLKEAIEREAKIE